MDGSLMVTGKSLEQALSKASQLLHCDPDLVGYEIVQEGKTGRSPATSIPFKLRVTAVTPAAQSRTRAPDDEEAEFTVKLPWLANMLAPLPPEMFCKALDGAFVDAVLDAPAGVDMLPPPAAAEDAPMREIAEDVVGHGIRIEFDGHVRVFGSVRKGAVIKAAGRVQVVGDVEASFIDARGDVTVGGGLLGEVRTVHGSVSCKFVQGGRIEAPFGNIAIAESVMHSHLHAGLRARIGDILIGGTCYGEQGVDTRVAGSELGVPTAIISGLNKRLTDRMEEIRLRSERHAARLRECERLRQTLLPVEERGDQLPIEDRVSLWKAAIRKGRIQTDLQHLARQKAKLLGLVNTERACRVCVKDKICPKVRVTIDESAIEIQRTTQYVTFSKDYDSGKIRLTSYQ
jgi:hypothetical protein